MTNTIKNGSQLNRTIGKVLSPALLMTSVFFCHGISANDAYSMPSNVDIQQKVVSLIEQNDAFTVNVYFDTDSAKITQEYQQLLTKLITQLQQIEEYLKHDKNIDKISVKAYSSSWGGRYTNLKVSQRRANEIKDVFEQFGIPGDKISVEGFGEKRHIASNQTILGRAENRRVVIEMVKP